MYQLEPHQKLFKAIEPKIRRKPYEEIVRDIFREHPDRTYPLPSNYPEFVERVQAFLDIREKIRNSSERKFIGTMDLLAAKGLLIADIVKYAEKHEGSARILLADLEKWRAKGLFDKFGGTSK
ncbi:MAG: hypothetical protein NTY90_00420 [Candidatus Micrarchaeota archaeon]|nr:hypothetical protein [Candidatus Micrarchaeota archaeon]